MGTFLVIEEMRLKIESHFLKNRVLIVLVVSVYGDMINDQTVRSGLGKHLNVFFCFFALVSEGSPDGW